MSLPQILIVDDTAAERTLLKIAFERSGYDMKLYFAASGRIAIDMLRGAVAGEPPIRPNLILLDVKMPAMSGIEVLKTLKSDKVLLDIPVIMFSGSDDQNDVRACYSNFASGYIKKPSGMEALGKIAEFIGQLSTQIYVFPQ